MGEKRGPSVVRRRLCCSWSQMDKLRQEEAQGQRAPQLKSSLVPSVVCGSWTSGFTSMSPYFLLDTMGWEPRCCRMDVRLNEMHVECLRREQTFLSPWLVWWVMGSWCPSVLGQLDIDSSCPSPGKGCLCRKAATPPPAPQPLCPLQLITQLSACLTFGWTCSWGFWALSPSPFSLTLEWGKVCVCVRACVCGWEMLVNVWTSEWVGVLCYMIVTESE